MTLTPRQACSALLTNALADVVVVTSGKRWKVSQATATNTDILARTLTLHLIASGGVADDTNILYKALSINAGVTAPLPELIGHTLEPGMAIHAAGSVTSKVNLIVSVYEVAA